MTEQQKIRLDETVPQPAEGLELMGLFEGSGFKEKPYLARRADGQVVQLSQLLYLVTEAVDGQRDFEGIANRVTEEFGRVVSADNVRYLVENKLRLLGVVADADGSSTRPERATPLFMLRYKVGLVPASVVRAITSVLWPLFLSPVVLCVILGVVAFDVWVVLFHGGIGSGIQEAIYAPGAFVILSFVVSSVAVALHECGHATACRYGGARPGALGIGIYIVWLIFYSDVTDSYRLSKRGRIRTDLGGLYMESVLILGIVGAYFYTGYELLLPLIVLMQVSFLDDLLPILRFDGYYVVSDITGVPDLFGRIKPILKSMIPGQQPDRQVTELMPWVRVVVTAWVLTVVPVLITVVSILAFYLPLIISTAWDSFLRHSRNLSESFAEGNVFETLKSLFQIGALSIPVLGVILILSIWGRRFGRAAWSASVGRPLLRAGFVAAPVIVVGIILAAWWPGFGQEEQVQNPQTPAAQGKNAAPQEAPDTPAGSEWEAAPAAPESAGQAPPTGLVGCAGGQERCVKQLVAQVSPQAEYVGGRIDTQTGGSGQNRNVLYFVDPAMQPCRYERLEYSANDGTIHTAIVAGEGSFGASSGAGCIPGY